LNIYIYGNHTFKKEIYETLEHSNIKFKLDDNSLIKDINDLSELKRTIQDNPNDIYLIDDEKIIKKNSLNKKIKFLTPKDGIEEEFLLDSGIADLSINSLSEIPKYILRKYEEEKDVNSKLKDSIIDDEYDKENNLELDDELAQLLAKEETSIPKETEEESSVDEDLEDLFNINKDMNLGEPEDIFDSLENFEDNSSDVSKNEFDDIMNFNDNFGLNNISFDYDDEDITNDSQEKEDFSDMEFNNELEDENEVFENFNFLDEIFSNDKKEKIHVIEKIEKKEKVEEIEEKKSIENINTNESLLGDNMNDDKFFELDSLNEKDLIEALDYVDNKKDYKEQALSVRTDSVEKNTTSVNISSESSVDELAQLISKLLSNKTLEITIKIKD
jgi:hypothetical protein